MGSATQNDTAQCAWQCGLECRCRRTGQRTGTSRRLPHRVVQLAIGIFGQVEAGLAPGDYNILPPWSGNDGGRCQDAGLPRGGGSARGVGVRPFPERVCCGRHAGA